MIAAAFSFAKLLPMCASSQREACMSHDNDEDDRREFVKNGRGEWLDGACAEFLEGRAGGANWRARDGWKWPIAAKR
jgi:hypothetical protein